MIFFKNTFLSIMKIKILLIIAVSLIYGCNSVKKEHKTQLNWTKISNLMGDSNIVVELPNLLYCQSSIDKPCFGSAEQLLLNCFSMIGRDSIITEIASSIDFSIVKDPESQNDTLLLNAIANKFVVQLPYRTLVNEKGKLVFKKVKIINGRKMFIVKVSYGELTSYKVLYLSKSNYTRLLIDGIKNEEIFNQILQSIDIEKRRYFLCL